MKKNGPVILVLILVAFAPAVRGAAGTGEIRSQEDAPFWSPCAAPHGQYSMRYGVQIRSGSAKITVEEDIRFRNRTSRPICQIALRTPHAIEGETVQVLQDGREALEVGENKDRGVVRFFELSRPVAPGKKALVRVRYALDSILLGGLFEKETVVPLWYPKLWWGVESWNDFDVHLDIPKGYIVITSGGWSPSIRHFRGSDVRDFGIVVARNVRAVEKRMGDVSLTVFASPAGMPCATLLAETACDAIGFYQELFGFYPRRTLAIVPGADTGSGGMPIATGIVAVHGMARGSEAPDSEWQRITAHEIGHQYFGEHVLGQRCERWDDWLEIALGLTTDRDYVRAN